MAEASCRRELDLEIPAEEVTKATERVAKELARVARVPGFRPGKAPISLIKRRFADDIKGEVRQSLEFRAVFEVLPEFELGTYKGLEIEMPPMDVTDDDVNKALEETRERAAAFAPVEGRAVENGDFAQLKLVGTAADGGEPINADSVLCHVGAEETMEPFNTSLRGANIGDHKEFEVEYPADYPDEKLAGKKFHYAADVTGIKTKKLPELNDEFAKDVSDAATLEELKTKIRERLVHQRDHRQKDLQRERVIAELVKLHDFPVPESLVESQMDVRLERMVRSLAQQGVDPRAVNLDWSALRGRQQDRAK